MVAKSNRMKALTLLLIATLLSGCASTVYFEGPSGAEPMRYHATDLNTHCRDPQLAKRLRSMGPLYAVGASVSHGLFSASFPSLIKDQLCLGNEQYDSDFYFLWIIKSDRSILNSLEALRPNLVVSMDFPYHYVKLEYADKARPVLKKYLLMLLMECESELIDCSPDGQFAFQQTDPHRPTVLAGSIYFDCHADQRAQGWERAFPSYAVCREENQKLNDYLHQLAREYPRLRVLPAYDLIATMHDTDHGIYRYDVDGVRADFRKSDLFFDGFHPWTNPGAYVLANLVIDHINRIGRERDGEGFTVVPYIPLDLPSSPRR